MRAADMFVNRKDVAQIILVIAADDEENVRRSDGEHSLHRRQQSPG